VPQPDGSVDRRDHGRNETVLEAGHGRFLGGLSDGTVLVRPDDGAPIVTGRSVQVAVRAYRHGEAVGEIHLRVADAHRGRGNRLPPEPIVRVSGDRLYWMFLQDDYLEVRTIDPAVTLSGEF